MKTDTKTNPYPTTGEGFQVLGKPTPSQYIRKVFAISQAGDKLCLCFEDGAVSEIPVAWIRQALGEKV